MYLENHGAGQLLATYDVQCKGTDVPSHDECPADLPQVPVNCNGISATNTTITGLDR